MSDAIIPKVVYYPVVSDFEDTPDSPWITLKEFPCKTYEEAAKIAQRHSSLCWDVEEVVVGEDIVDMGDE